MYTKSSHLMFLFTLALGPLVLLSSNSYFLMWVGMEVNLMGFIPLMIFNKNKSSGEAAMKYFLVQAISSIIFLMGGMSPLFLFKEMNTLLILALWIKMAAAPFHYWVPSVASGLQWLKILILLTIQKINPLLIFCTLENFYLIFWMSALSALMGSWGGFGQTALKKIISFSSISHLAWILAAMMVSNSAWVLYFSLYAVSLGPLALALNKMNSQELNQLPAHSKSNNLLILVNLLSLGGLPPFLGFYPKWLILNSILECSQPTLVGLLLFTALINLYFYLRLSYPILMNQKITPPVIPYKTDPQGLLPSLTPMMGLLLAPLLLYS